MSKLIYHGSAQLIEQPTFGVGKHYNDYGMGFYCTEDIDLAKEWAVDFKRNGYANCYELTEQELKVLYLNSDEYCVLHWLAVLLQHRQFDIVTPLAKRAKEYLLEHFYVDVEQYDIVVGYRADDSYFAYARDFINGAISLRQLRNAMYLGELGEQIVIKSKKAFEAIRFVGYELALSEDWYGRKMDRDIRARQVYVEATQHDYQKGDLYITRILDEEMKQDDARLR